MKRIVLLLTLLVFAVSGIAALVKAESCPPGQHMGTGRKYGDLCYPNSAGPAAAAPTCVRHRVCKDGHCTMICR